MRFRGVHHVEFSVLNYQQSVEFYDRMFGWLGYKSFWTLDIGYRSTYYMARFPFFHSYIGIQPANQGQPLVHEQHQPGIHHIALWASRRKEVDRFYQEFLLPEQVTVTDKPEEYPVYAPGYYAVFFDDPSGIHWELAHTPYLPSPWAIYLSCKMAKKLAAEHPEWKNHPGKEMMRTLPNRAMLSRKQE